MKDENGNKISATTSQGRREYQRLYYQLHAEKAKAYQKAYNRTHKKKGAPRGVEPWRGVKKTCFNVSDLAHAPTPKFLRKVEAILSGRIGFTV